MLISIDMGFFSFLKYNFCDIFDKIRICKWKLILCIFTTLVGFVLGIVFFNISDCGWWYYNRCAYASKLTEANFSLLISFIVIAALVYLAYILCNLTRFTHYLALLVNLVMCIYSGATLSAIFVYSVMWGILYAIIIVVPWLATMCLACFLCMCEPPILSLIQKAERRGHVDKS